MYNYGAITRGDTTKKMIALVFTGGDFADGRYHILKTLNEKHVKGSFFFTGDFYRKAEFKDAIVKLKNAGHYLGPHSNKHLLYADWDKRDSTLITKDLFLSDLDSNYLELKKIGLTKKEAHYFLPPYEWYNNDISKWADEAGLRLINFTPGTSSNGDYTLPEDKNYYTSDSIYNKILKYEQKDKNGLNGFILLTHIGTDSRRTDKFYFKLGNLIDDLRKKGYKFVRIDELLKNE